MSKEDIASTLEVKDGIEELDSLMMLKVYRSMVQDGVVELVSQKMPNVELKNGWPGLVLWFLLLLVNIQRFRNLEVVSTKRG